MNLDAIKKLFAYDNWATGRIISTAENLTNEQFLQPDDTPFGSIRNELVHLLDTKLGWVRMIEMNRNGIFEQAEDLQFDDVPDVASVKALAERVAKESDALLGKVSDVELTRVLTFDFEWGPISAPLWEVLVHLVNHGTQHRSETAMKLTNFGHSPDMLDLLFFNESGDE